MSTALRLFGLLDILFYMPSSPSLRAPCIHAHLRALATKPYEISGLAQIFHTDSTTAPQSGMSTALRLWCLLDILSYMPSSPSLRAPCIHARLRRLATNRY